MKKYVVVMVVSILSVSIKAQQKPLMHINQFVDVSSAIGSNEGTISASFARNWRLGNKKKLEMGLGIRATSYFGAKKEFYTAPARLARSNTIPFAIVFAGHEEKNVDTLTVQRPLVASLNLSANFGYHFGSKWYGGINIDLIGFTVGRTTSAVLLSNGNTTTEPAAKPTAFNVLLTGDNDYGSLNSEFFVKYKIAGRWYLKGVYQFYFAEYKTQSVKQIAPDGTIVDRFRNKVNAIGLGISYDL